MNNARLAAFMRDTHAQPGAEQSPRRSAVMITLRALQALGVGLAENETAECQAPLEMDESELCGRNSSQEPEGLGPREKVLGSGSGGRLKLPLGGTGKLLGGTGAETLLGGGGRGAPLPEADNAARSYWSKQWEGR
jgi:hypothetical protein